VVGRGIPVTRAALAANAERKAFSLPNRCGAPISDRCMAGATSVLNRADLAEPEWDPASSRIRRNPHRAAQAQGRSLDRFGNIAIDLAPAAPEKTSS
jgi:hypothetical protein